eukprot:5930116-Karenia_brevis.AAC.1
MLKKVQRRMLRIVLGPGRRRKSVESVSDTSQCTGTDVSSDASSKVSETSNTSEDDLLEPWHEW